MVKNILKNILVINLLLFITYISNAAAQEKDAKILIINSDSKISKYTEAVRGFAENYNQGIKIVHLDNPRSMKNLAVTISEYQPSLIYCIGSKSYILTRKHANKDIPVVFSSVLGWQRLSMNNITYGIDSELQVRHQLSIVRLLLPDINKIGILYSERFRSNWVKSVLPVANELGFRVNAVPVNKPVDIEAGLKELVSKVDVLWLVADPVVLSSVENVNAIFKNTKEQELPVIAYNATFIKHGASLALSSDSYTMGIQASYLAKDILKGSDVSGKVQQPIGSNVILNLKVNREFGVKINDSALDSVNEIIQ